MTTNPGCPALYLPDRETLVNSGNPHACILEADLPCLACALIEVLGEDRRAEALDLAHKVGFASESEIPVLWEILHRKLAGHDCNDDESALIRGFLRFNNLGRLTTRLGIGLVGAFPLEWDEVDLVWPDLARSIVGLVGTALDPTPRDVPKLSINLQSDGMWQLWVPPSEYLPAGVPAGFVFEDIYEGGTLDGALLGLWGNTYWHTRGEAVEVLLGWLDEHQLDARSIFDLLDEEWRAIVEDVQHDDDCDMPHSANLDCKTDPDGDPFTVYVPGCFPLVAADRWMYQAHDHWMAVAPGESEAAWFADCDDDRTWTPRPRVYPIGELPPFGTVTYLLDDGKAEHTHSVDRPIGRRHPLACPFCGSEDVSASQPDYQVRPARLNPDGSYTIGEQTDAADWDGPNLLYCTACNSDYPVPPGTKEHFDADLKVEYPAHGEQPNIGAKVRWTVESYIPEAKP